MLTIDRQIQELRMELAACLLTRRERVQARRELDTLLTRHADRNGAVETLAADDPAPD
ncbi:hypothetical protein [Azospirillum humicireducens]|uniref:hypothetical protein n=1 Tax=Azospirillum humicireducens TaxID=1226968 RepID=UPI000ACDE41A|nr:hypothetical protein [Azospirillum humicireducens]